MSLFKFLDRVKRIDALVRNKATGTPDELAKKLEISKSMLMLNLSELKKLGVPIEYSTLHRSYIYVTEYKLSIDNLLSRKEYSLIKGGTCHVPDFSPSTIYEQYKLGQTFFAF
jgi:biotin operon repressor